MINFFKNKIVIVTGGSGYIGSSLISSLKGKPKKIIRVSRKILKPENAIEDWQLDLSKDTSWQKIVLTADIIFHLSGNTSIYKSEENEKESLISTVIPIKLLIESAQRLSRKPRVIFASTATVYGLTHVSPVSETLKPKPITKYDLHKYLAEKELTRANQENIINASSLRFSNVFGPSLNESSEADRGILSKVVKMALEGKSIKIYGDGKYLRDYVFIEDAVDAMIHASIITSSKSIFNAASGVSTSVQKAFNMVAIEVERMTGNKVQVVNIAWPKKIHRIEKRNFTASIDLLISNSEWRPKVSLQKGIQLLIKHYLNEKTSKFN